MSDQSRDGNGNRAGASALEALMAGFRSIRRAGAATASARRRCSTRKGLAYEEIHARRRPGFRAAAPRPDRRLDGAADPDRRRADRRLHRALAPRPRRPARRAARRLRRLERAGTPGRTTCRARPTRDLRDRRAAAVARLAVAAVDLELVLHRAAAAVRQRGSRGASSPAARCRARAPRGSRGASAAARRGRGSPAGRSGWMRARQSASST